MIIRDGTAILTFVILPQLIQKLFYAKTSETDTVFGLTNTAQSGVTHTPLAMTPDRRLEKGSNLTKDKTPKAAAKRQGDNDHGKVGEVDRILDPATAPLGTDAETAATPPIKEKIQTDGRRKAGKRPVEAKSDRERQPIHRAARSPSPLKIWSTILLVVAVAILGILLAFAVIA